MKKVAPRRVFSLAMIVAVLSMSILACAFAPKMNGDSQKATSDQQLPFEENEKGFEDKDEVDEKGNEFGVSLYVIDQIGRPCYISTLNSSTSRNYTSKNQLPLFLTNRTLLI